MTGFKSNGVKTGGFAPLKNLVLLAGLAEKLMARGPHLPGIGVFYGHSGYGKTMAATYVQNKFTHHGLPAPRVEVLDSWTRIDLMRAILSELGVDQPRGTLSAMSRLAIELLADADHPPLLIDEADKLLSKNMVELVRELHMASSAPIILIGEEALPAKLQTVERAHNRVLDWVPAEPCDLEDTRKLARFYCPQVTVSDELLNKIRVASQGRARRIAVNCNMLADYAARTGQATIDETAWQAEMYTGTPPARRAS